MLLSKLKQTFIKNKEDFFSVQYLEGAVVMLRK